MQKLYEISSNGRENGSVRNGRHHQDGCCSKPRFVENSCHANCYYENLWILKQICSNGHTSREMLQQTSKDANYILMEHMTQKGANFILMEHMTQKGANVIFMAHNTQKGQISF